MFWQRSEEARKTALLSISIITGRAATFIFFVLIGNRFGVSDVSDEIWTAYAPIAVIASIVTAVADGVLLPIIITAEKSGLEKLIYSYSIKKIPYYVSIGSVCIIIPFSLVTGRFDFIILSVLLPVPYIYSISAVRSAILNARGIRNTVAISPVGGFIFVLFVIFLLPTSGIYFAVLFLVFELGRLITLSIPFKSIEIKCVEVSNRANLLITEGINRAKYQVAGVVAWSLNYLIDIWFASRLGVGAVTCVEYANKIWSVVPLLFQGVLLIFYINYARNKHQYPSPEKNGVSRIALKNGILAALLCIPIFIYSRFIVLLLYGYGNINADAIDELSNVLRYYLPGCGPYVAGLFYARSLFAEGKTIVTAYVGVFGLLINLVGNYFFVRFFGLIGIAMSTSVMLTLTTVLLYLYFIHNRTLN